MNQVLKWLLHGERPYWWIEDSSNLRYLKGSVITHSPHSSQRHLHHTPRTCETGPGNPSVHAMINLVLWLIVADALTSSKFVDNYLNEATRTFVKRMTWNAFYLMQALVFVSRTYISAHFPHQVILGLIFGNLVLEIAYRNHKWLKWSTIRSIFTALGLLVSALAVHMLIDKLMAKSGGANWSVAKAEKWCKKSDWIYVDTTPHYTLVRYAGAAMGLALSIRLWNRISKKQPKQKQQSPFLAWVKVTGITMILAYSFGQIAEHVRGRIPSSSPKDLTFFYIANYVLNCVLVFSVSVIAPYCTNFVLHSKDADK